MNPEPAGGRLGGLRQVGSDSAAFRYVWGDIPPGGSMNAVSTYTSTYTGPRWLGYFLGAIALVTLFIAAGNTPLIEWGSGEFILGGVLVLIVIWFFIAAYRGRINIIGSTRGKSAQLVGVIGLFITGFVLGVNLGRGGDWSVVNIEMTGIFVVLGILFLAAYILAARKIREGR
jgi:hypothetical protein